MDKLEKKRWKEIGYQLTNGVWRCAGVFVLIMMIFSFLFYAVRNETGWGKDSSDPSGGFSNLTVRTDALTGCEYLYEGSLIPRMDSTGHQICNGHH